MTSHLELSLQRDMERIRDQVLAMGQMVVKSLRDCMDALAGRNLKLAYGIILRDQRIDEREKAVDRLCLDFIVRQQPVAGHLRFVYTAIKTNADLERVGDYAESIARQILKLADFPDQTPPPTHRVMELAELAIPLLHDAVQAFANRDVSRAGDVIRSDMAVDDLRARTNAEYLRMLREGSISLDVMDPLMNIVRRLERVADQAVDIALDVLYMCTGQDARHPGADAYRILFADEYNSCRSRMAEMISQAMNLPRFVFCSAGLEARPVDEKTLNFMREKGFDLACAPPRSIDQVPNFEHYQVIVLLAPEVRRALPPHPAKPVFLDWSIPDPSRAPGSPEDVRQAYESAFQTISSRVKDLVDAVLGYEGAE